MPGGPLAAGGESEGEDLDWVIANVLEAGITLAQYALPEIPDAKDVNGLLNAGGEAIDKTIPMHYRLVGRLMLAAEAVETALGLEPLPERLKEDDLATDEA